MKRKRQNIRKTQDSSFRHAIPTIYFFVCLFVSSMALPSLSTGEERGDIKENVPLWWPDTGKRAKAGGYQLINFQELQALIQSEKEFLLLDTRPDYAYRESHVPGARNFEFHLGHRSRLEPERAEALKALIGEDRDRMVVTYCRNFR